MQKVEHVTVVSPQPCFEREESSSGNLEGRKIEYLFKENLNNKTNDHVIFLLGLIIELGNLLKDVIERQEKESEEIKSKFAKSSLEIAKLQIKSNTLDSELETIVDILKGFNRQISHLENCADQISQDSINAINVVKTQLSILEKNLLKRVEEMESEVEYNANETSNAFDKICLIKRYIESKTGDDLSDSNNSKPNKINKFVKAAL
ncbi:hypothetical protein [Criblamydia sequanensis]|uniref:Uncharacterized protein n=1 Tax=Candidatus Criblamydia sequanensis CRIB-18 TaxID=1437425 RepID=A0A090D2V9_9BACT|nr:hypothetical protein [Criblamydia sequanensis]CDR34990.1 hypothetical protein CSEC_2184 [Criblamydia sequanensis CRIB-18]